MADEIKEMEETSILVTEERIRELRLKNQTGNLTMEECREALAYIKQTRDKANVAAAAKKAKAAAKKEKPDGEALLNGLLG